MTHAAGMKCVSTWRWLLAACNAAGRPDLGPRDTGDDHLVRRPGTVHALRAFRSSLPTVVFSWFAGAAAFLSAGMPALQDGGSLSDRLVGVAALLFVAAAILAVGALPRVRLETGLWWSAIH
jgi:hypothetical protein